MTPSQHFSTLLADALFGVPENVRADSAALRAHFAHCMAEAEAPAPDDTPQQRQSQDMAVAALAAGLFALGDPSHAGKIARMPPLRARITMMTGALDAMMPEAFENRDTPALAAAAEANADRLVLDEAAGVYRLADA